MKILFLSSWYPNKIEPYNGNFVQRHAETVATKHNVEVLHVVGDFNQNKEFVWDDQQINGIRTLIIYYRNTKNPFLNFKRRMKAYSMGFSKMNVPDLVHANIHHNSMLFAYYLKKKFKIPYVISEHWSGIRPANQHKLSLIEKKIIKRIGNNASYIMPVTQDLEKGLKKLGIITPSTIIPNVVDTDLFLPLEENFKITKFIHVSSLIPLKNADLILKTAIKLLEKGYQFQLQIGGDGTKESVNKLKKIAGSRKEIEVFGAQTIQEISKRMQLSTCFILLSDTENQPCVVSEAFSSGLDVIATNVGGIPEYFPTSFGILVEKVDEKLLENAMLEIIAKNNVYSKKEKHQYAQKTFSREVIAQQISDIYTNIVFR